MKTGLFFGSFNPVHNGHMMIANYMIEFTDLDQLWFVISPHNPLKTRKTLLNDYDRLLMLEYAIEGDSRFQVCDIEYRMPKPSYTVDTLVYLSELHPSREFVLIMGSDNILSFDKWKNNYVIEENYQRYVYPRKGFEIDSLADLPNVKIVDAPQIDISATFIREAVKNKRQISWFLPQKVYDYILKMNFYAD